eukprot:7286481-Karenia_brevis.AAC.1
METSNKFLFDTISASFHERAERAERMCAETASEITELHRKYNAQQKRREALEKQLEIDNSKEAITNDVSYGCRPMANVARVKLPQAVSKNAIQHAVGEWLRDLGAGKWQIIGSPSKPSRFWGVLFKGPAGAAARKADNAIQALRDDS